jgi:glycosyltransferase involved in cell wall biosynthesis
MRAQMLIRHEAEAGNGPPSAEPAGIASDDAAPMRTILVAQLGARRHYAVPRALWRAGLLDRLVTDFCADGLPWARLAEALPSPALPAAARRLLQRRAGDIPSERIASLSAFALDPRLRRRRGETPTDFWARRNAAFCEAVAKRGFGEAGIVYAFNGAALEIFEAARRRGLTTILDQTAAPWRWNAALLREEAERWPGWETDPAELDASGRLAAREEAEWALADTVVAGSQFAKAALGEAGGPVRRTSVAPYPAAAIQTAAARAFPSRFDTRRKLRVLFVGTLQLRKGIPYLDEAARSLRDAPVEFRLVGPSQLSDEAHRRLAETFDISGPAPRTEVFDHYRWADVLVLPTLSEGSANVCYEAAAAGLPVLTTPNAGSAMTDGHSALIVQPRDSEAIASALLRLMGEPALLPALAQAASVAVSGRSLEVYAIELVGCIGQLANNVRCTDPPIAAQSAQDARNIDCM